MKGFPLTERGLRRVGTIVVVDGVKCLSRDRAAKTRCSDAEETFGSRAMDSSPEK